MSNVIGLILNISWLYEATAQEKNKSKFRPDGGVRSRDAHESLSWQPNQNKSVCRGFPLDVQMFNRIGCLLLDEKSEDHKKLYRFILWAS